MRATIGSALTRRGRLYDLVSTYKSTEELNSMLLRQAGASLPVTTGDSLTDLFAYVNTNPQDRATVRYVEDSVKSAIEAGSSALVLSLFNGEDTQGSTFLSTTLRTMKKSMSHYYVYNAIKKTATAHNIGKDRLFATLLNIGGYALLFFMVCDDSCPMSLRKVCVERVTDMVCRQGFSDDMIERGYVPNRFRGFIVIMCVSLAKCIDMYDDVARSIGAFKTLIRPLVLSTGSRTPKDLLLMILSYSLDGSVLEGGDNRLFSEYIGSVSRTVMYIEDIFGVNASELAQDDGNKSVLDCLSSLFHDDV